MEAFKTGVILPLLLVLLLPAPALAGSEGPPPNPCEQLKDLALIRAIREKKAIVDKEAVQLDTDIATLGRRCKPYMGDKTVQTGIEMAELNQSRLAVSTTHGRYLRALLDFSRFSSKATLAFDYLKEKDCRTELSLLEKLYDLKSKNFGTAVKLACSVD